MSAPTGRNGRIPIVVLGAGPSGLGAASLLAERGPFEVTVLERNSEVGGNAGSFELEGLRVDFGSHRLHPSCPAPILADIGSMLGEDLLDRPRHGRIRLRGRWVHFPLKPVDLALHLPWSFAAGVASDSLSKMVKAAGPEDSFEAVLQRGLGRTICRDFYFPYARKIWGVAPSELDAEQAKRRVSAGSLARMVRKVLSAVPGFKPKGAGRFFYPRKGFGAISEAYGRRAAQAGAALRLQTALSRIDVEGGRIRTVHAQADGATETLEATQVLSTVPLPALVRALHPAAPAQVLESAGALKSRAMLLIYLVLETEQFTEYDAHYFPDAEIAITRLSEPKNYGLAELPGRTVLCAELPCATTDAVWTWPDEQLGRLMRDALEAADLPVRVPTRAIAVRRLPNAYPIYTRHYREHFDRIDAWLGGIEGLLTFGRQGLFAHDNTHHTLAMAYAVNDCLNDRGQLDIIRWAEFRREFQQHVVED